MNNRDTWMVITSIYTPRKTLIESLSLGWSVVVVGDEKSPHGEWSTIKLENFHYLDPEKQKKLFPEFSVLMGFGTYTRKNIGYLFAIQNGAKAIWDTDDDTLIRENAKSYFQNLEGCEFYEVNGGGYFNPYKFFTNQKSLWPRGYPLRKIANERVVTAEDLGIVRLNRAPKFDILQTLVNLEPDLDAIYRMTVGDEVLDFDCDSRIVILNGKTVSPGNTQSTLWVNPDKFKFLYVPRWVSFRFCDILKMYIAQRYSQLAYAGFWSEQDRNLHDYLVDFESEVECYLKTELVVEFLQGSEVSSLCDVYKGLYHEGLCREEEIQAAALFEELVERYQIE
jgi:hypothetical protein